MAQQLDPLSSLCVQAWAADGFSDTVPSSSTAKHERGSGPFSRMNLFWFWLLEVSVLNMTQTTCGKTVQLHVSINTQGPFTVLLHPQLINMFTSLPPSFSLSVCPFPSFLRAPPPLLSLPLFSEQIIRLFLFPLFFSQTSLYPASAQTLLPLRTCPCTVCPPVQQSTALLQPDSTRRTHTTNRDENRNRWRVFELL